MGVLEGRRQRIAWVALAGALYGLSLALPAVVYEGETVWPGVRAAALSVFFPLVWAMPLGFLLSLLYPLLGLTVIGIVKRRAFATGTAIALVATMALWGFSVPEKPESNVFGGTSPGGALGWGFWLWLASGVCLLVASLASREPERLKRFVIAGLVYAGAVAFSSLYLVQFRRAAVPTEAELRAVEAEKREASRPH
jgi:hypothetical protein